ncbi:hypothetical protein RBH26_14545 [Natronolimnohabitans sp. A-GB9]|uniref:hypothetical protein n=1 Tax=Natronolimnohabitans sp. A-GB9 TaxID=3069757 RepID=UPI0027B3DB08|nr:hypothetical protein [Natronolimnohabitans sp. A-GB9]MDQ2051695.1 hypothetical protein [Natronolimnohabitans sp. A-GB9]
MNQKKPQSAKGASRRTVMKTLGVATLTGIGASGVAGAASDGEVDPDDLHSDDKHVFDAEKLESDEAMSGVYRESPLYLMEEVSDGYLVYYDVEEVEEEFETVSYEKDGPSITEQLQSDPKTKKAKEESSNTIDKIKEEERSNIRPQSSHDFTVFLGSDRSRSLVDDGDAETYTIWGNKNAEYSVSDRETRTDISVSPTALSDPGAYAELSSVFQVSGSGTESATITVETYHQGTLWAAAGATSEIDIEFTVENLSGSGSWSSSILNEQVSGLVNDEDFQGNEETSITVNLEAGNHYRLAIEQTSTCYVGGYNGATNRFGGYLSGGNFNDEYVQHQNWNIEF